MQESKISEFLIKHVQYFKCLVVGAHPQYGISGYSATGEKNASVQVHGAFSHIDRHFYTW